MIDITLNIDYYLTMKYLYNQFLFTNIRFLCCLILLVCFSLSILSFLVPLFDPWSLINLAFRVVVSLLIVLGHVALLHVSQLFFGLE